MQAGSQDIILITRADDMGYTHTGNLAILDSMRCGIIKSAAILVISPWFEEAAQIARQNPDLCFGVHLGIIGEWRGYRWRPVLPYSEIRTLVDEDGLLHRSPDEFWAHNPDMGELEKEFRAQIDLAKKKGVKVDYLDTHYIMPYHPKFRPVIDHIRSEYQIPVSCLLGERELDDFGIYSPAPEEKEGVLARLLENLEPGVNLLIGHPGYPSIENDALVHFAPQDVQTLGVGRNRAAETLAYTSPRIRRIVQDRRIRLMSYREFSERQNNRS
jgi:chitin disaccharide deacetylase